jgi:hypothetical protein
MPKKAPQFFQKQTPTRSNRAIYELPRKDSKGKPIIIAVECIEGSGNVPRNAASPAGILRKFDLDKELDSISAVAEVALEKLKALKPGEVEIEFGVELGGEFGVPLLTKGEARANFKVTLKWSAEKKV